MYASVEIHRSIKIYRAKFLKHLILEEDASAVNIFDVWPNLYKGKRMKSGFGNLLLSRMVQVISIYFIYKKSWWLFFLSLYFFQCHPIKARIHNIYCVILTKLRRCTGRFKGLFHFRISYRFNGTKLKFLNCFLLLFLLWGNSFHSEGNQFDYLKH